MNHDNELLGRFADEGSQEAFAELVRLKVDLVFAAALRQTGGDAHLAQDVTRGVFTARAGGASSLARHAVITGWLFTTTRYLAISAMRQQCRWQRREQEANAMNVSTANSDPTWEQLRPVIDEALHELDARDRDALLLRFFEGCTLAEVGTAIGLAENSARMRVERALGKLRGRLEKHGITSTAAALSTALAAQPPVAAPAGLALVVTGASLTSAANGIGAFTTTFTLMNTIKIGGGVVVVVLAFLGGLYFRNAPERSATIATPSATTSADAKLVGALRAEVV